MKNLKLLRKKSGLSQRDFAEIIHASQNTVSQWESGKREPSYAIAREIANYFNVSVDYLLGIEEKTAPLELSLTEKQQLILDLAEQLSDEDAKKLIDYAKLLKKANNQ